jgi:serine/threonine-protein kinase
MSQNEQGLSEETIAWSSDSGETPVRDLTGTTLGDFQVIRLLGRGGMGQVYLATQISLDRLIALKVLHPRFLSKPAYLSRFEAEATAVAKLNHPNIVHVYTLGHVDQVRFIAMEYVEGTNLRDYINKKGALDLPLGMSIMRQAGQAIGAAGEVGLIHRDIKPENLLITRKGRVKVADFGLCRDLGSDRFHVTQPGITMGTPLYMSPEQAQGKPLDHRSDLYSLGVSFYHMLTGFPPFQADSAVALALKHVQEPPVRPSVHRPEIPVELENMILKLMAKDPAERYQSAAEFLADLAKIRGTLLTVRNGIVGDDAAAARGDEAAVARGIAGLREDSSSSAIPASLRTLARILASPWSLAMATALFLAAGGVLGWSLRPSGLPEIDASQITPGLAIEPRWSSIPRQDGPEEQYIFAQFKAAPDDLAAAWMAVPGYFTHSAETVSRAYVQYARLLYRQRDLDRLAALISEFSTWAGAKTSDKHLAEILQSSVKLLSKDLDGVIEGMTHVAQLGDSTRYEPGLLEFCVEIVADAAKLASQPGTSASESKTKQLLETQLRLIRALRQVRMDQWAGR